MLGQIHLAVPGSIGLFIGEIPEQIVLAAVRAPDCKPHLLIGLAILEVYIHCGAVIADLAGHGGAFGNVESRFTAAQPLLQRGCGFGVCIVEIFAALGVGLAQAVQRV